MSKRLVFRDQIQRTNNVTRLPYPLNSKDRGKTVNISRTEVVLDGANPVMALPARPDRKTLQIHNTTASAATYDINRPADANSFPIPLLASNIDVFKDQNCPLEPIWVFSAVANTRLLIVESF